MPTCHYTSFHTMHIDESADNYGVAVGLVIGLAYSIANGTAVGSPVNMFVIFNFPKIHST